MNETRRVAVVSGGGPAFGRELALERPRRGYDLALLGRRRQPLEETLELTGFSGAVFPCDVRDAEAVDRCAAAVRERWGAAALVVPAAGVVSLAPIEETTPEDFAAMLDTNLTGTFLLLRALL